MTENPYEQRHTLDVQERLQHAVGCDCSPVEPHADAANDDVTHFPNLTRPEAVATATTNRHTHTQHRGEPDVSMQSVHVG